jgi:hippurate hydrolase
MHVAFRRLGLGLVRTVGAVGLVGQVGAAAGQESAGGKAAPAQVARAATTPAAALVDAELPALLDIYRGLHRHPELSHHEVRTAAFIAGELRKLGFSVTERVGRYADGTQAYGVVAVLANGPGPTVLLRTELDALPVTEATGLPYASVDRSRNQAGDEVGVMHACGHDIHMTSVLGTARAMVELKSRWHGRLMVVAQPAEEVIDGARAMLADHLYERFGRPDYAIALHDTPLLAAGTVAVTGGPVLANASTVDVTLRGVGGHGASPQSTKDPIVMAAEFIMALQTIVSREDAPTDPAVVTVGMIHGGTKSNIIPDEVKLGLTVRAFSEPVRLRILADIERIAKGVALTAGVPPYRAPLVVIDPNHADATVNDVVLAARLHAVFVRVLGADRVIELPPSTVSEDFGEFGLDDHAIPTTLYWLGAMPRERLEESRRTGVPLPSLHSSRFAPLPEPTLRTGVLTETNALLELFGAATATG